MKVSKVAKAWVAAIGTTVTALAAVFADNIFDGNEAGGLASVVVAAVLTVYGVYKTPNSPVDE